MRRIKITVSTTYVGSKDEDFIEVEDDTTDKEISRMAFDAKLGMIDYGWEEVEEDV